MAKLSLSDVSKKFNVDRSTIYRAVRNGRLSRSADGQFDIAEVIRCFGDPEPTSQKSETSKQEIDDATKKLITHWGVSQLSLQSCIQVANLKKCKVCDLV